MKSIDEEKIDALKTYAKHLESSTGILKDISNLMLEVAEILEREKNEHDK